MIKGTGRQLLIASPRGFCAGVERAVGVVERLLETHGTPIYVRKEIVHNQAVVEDFRSRDRWYPAMRILAAVDGREFFLGCGAVCADDNEFRFHTLNSPSCIWGASSSQQPDVLWPSVVYTVIQNWHLDPMQG